MAAKKTSNTKAFQLTNDEAVLVNAYRAVKSAREAKKAHEVASDNFESLIDDFRYADEDDDSFF